MRKPFSTFAFAIAVGLVAVVAFILALRVPFGAFDYTGVEPALAAAPGRATLDCDVAYVNDGDTLRCRDGTRIRLHAIAARETDDTCSPGHPCPQTSAAAATGMLKEMVSGKRIHCETTGHNYERVTAICWTPEGVEINCAMIRSGAALIWDRFNRESPICRRS